MEKNQFQEVSQTWDIDKFILSIDFKMILQNEVRIYIYMCVCVFTQYIHTYTYCRQHHSKESNVTPANMIPCKRIWVYG